MEHSTHTIQHRKLWYWEKGFPFPNTITALITWTEPHQMTVTLINRDWFKDVILPKGEIPLLPFTSLSQSRLINTNLLVSLSTLFIIDESWNKLRINPIVIAPLITDKSKRYKPSSTLKTGFKRFPFNNFKYFSLSFQSAFLLSFTLLVHYRFLVNI